MAEPSQEEALLQQDQGSSNINLPLTNLIHVLYRATLQGHSQMAAALASVDAESKSLLFPHHLGFQGLYSLLCHTSAPQDF